MTGSRTAALMSALLFGVAACCWTVAGETSNPDLSARELPPEVLGECASAGCVDEANFQSRWVGHTPQGNLFIVGRVACTPAPCTYWLVQKGSAATHKLLELNGAFTLHRSAGRYPVIELRTRSDEEGSMHLRFEWNGKEYARTAARRIYEVNGVECGTREECRVAAERALKAQQVDRALRIWQRVHGVSWI